MVILQQSSPEKLTFQQSLLGAHSRRLYGGKVGHMADQHIRRLATRKLIPGARFGKEWRFRHSDLDRAFREASSIATLPGVRDFSGAAATTCEAEEAKRTTKRIQKTAPINRCIIEPTFNRVGVFLLSAGPIFEYLIAMQSQNRSVDAELQ